MLLLCLMGVESQSTIDKTMPIRVFSYEGADYRTQLVERDEAAREASQNGNKGLAKAIRAKKFYPVITAVIYYVTKRRKTLLECLDIPPELDGLIEDRKINVIELAWLSDEKEKTLKGDLRFLVDALKQIRLTGRYNPKNLWEVRHLEDALRVLQALTGHDKLFEEAILKYHEGGRKNMIDLVGGIYRAGVHEGLMNVKEKVSEARAKGLNLIEVLKSLEPTPEEKAEARMYKKLYLPNLNLTERRRKTRAEVILAQEIHQEINQAVREQAARVFARGAEILKDIGASPEDIAKFLAIYPPQDNKS